MNIYDKNPILDGYVTLNEFAASVGKTTRTVRRWHAQGLPIIKRGTLVLINVEHARAWLAAGEHGGFAEPKRRHLKNDVANLPRRPFRGY